MPVAQPGYTQDYEAHSHRLDCYSYRYIWDRIRDCYEDYLTRCHFNAVHKSWELLASVMSSYRTMRQYGASMFSDGYTRPDIPSMPIELRFTDVLPPDDQIEEGVEYCLEDTTDATGHTFFIPERFRLIYSLTDFINTPTRYLYSDVDYTLTIDNRSGRQGKIVFGVNTVWAASMWALLYTTKHVEELIGRFGPLVEYFDMTHNEADTISRIHALLRVQQGGPVANLIELGISVINDWPFTTERCAVVAMAADGSWLDVDPMLENREVYRILNSTGLPLRVRGDDWAWSNVTVRTVLEPWRALTQAAEVHDIVSDPEMAEHFSLSTIECYHTMVIDLDGDLPLEYAVLEYYNATGAMVPGGVITGTLSGATADIISEEYDAVTHTGTLQLDNLLRNFYAEEVFDNGLGVTAQAVAPATQEYDVVAPDSLVERNKKSTAFALIVFHFDWTPEIGDIPSTMGDYPGQPDPEIDTDAMDYPEVPDPEIGTDGFLDPEAPDIEEPYTTYADVPATPLETGFDTSYEDEPGEPDSVGIDTDYV